MEQNFDAAVILSHGSVLCGAEQNLLDLARALQERLGIPIEAAFLNYTAPHFDAAVEKLATAGAKRIRVIPYFLVHGKFLKEDLPPLLAAADAKYDVEVSVAGHIGFHELLADAVIAAASREAESDAALHTAASFCRNNPRCPLHGRPECPRSSSVSAEAAR